MDSDTKKITAGLAKNEAILQKPTNERHHDANSNSINSVSITLDFSDSQGSPNFDTKGLHSLLSG